MALNLSNRVIDTLESNTILIYSRKYVSLLYTQSGDRMTHLLNDWLKVDESQKQELWIKSVDAKENCELIYNKIFCANAKNNFKCNHYRQNVEEMSVDKMHEDRMPADEMPADKNDFRWNDCRWNDCRWNDCRWNDWMKDARRWNFFKWNV